MKTALELLDRNSEELKAKLDVSDEVIKKAKEFISKLNGTGMHSKSVAGGAVYIAGVLIGERKTQREVALAFGVVETTIRKSYRRIASAADIEITV
ncbi:MAG: hypothetical protein ABH874_00850 [Methanobacteriota archaeon]